MNALLERTSQDIDADLNLSAAEAWVLLNLSREPNQPLKVALIELLARGTVALEWHKVRNRLGIPRRRAAFAIGSGSPVGEVLQAAYEFVSRAPLTWYPCGSLGVEARDVALMARIRCEGRGFRKATVEPSLLRAGLLEERERRFLFLRWTTLEPSPKGARIAADIRRQLAIVEDDLDAAAHSPDMEAPNRVAAAGPMLLLLRKRYRELEQLSHGSGAARTTSDIAFGHSFSTSLPDFDLSCLDGIDAVFDAIGNAFDSAGGDGGSDGGGDGGGGD